MSKTSSSKIPTRGGKCAFVNFCAREPRGLKKAKSKDDSGRDEHGRKRWRLLLTAKRVFIVLDIAIFDCTTNDATNTIWIRRCTPNGAVCCWRLNGRLMMVQSWPGFLYRPGSGRLGRGQNIHFLWIFVRSPPSTLLLARSFRFPLFLSFTLPATGVFDPAAGHRFNDDIILYHYYYYYYHYVCTVRFCETPRKTITAVTRPLRRLTRAARVS